MHFFSLDVMVSFSGMRFFYISSSVSNFFSGYVHSHLIFFQIDVRTDSKRLSSEYHVIAGRQKDVTHPWFYYADLEFTPLQAVLYPDPRCFSVQQFSHAAPHNILSPRTLSPFCASVRFSCKLGMSDPCRFVSLLAFLCSIFA